ncbi:MAG: hypothetical protein K0R75_2355 [Paenibacillaceae bacterium]|jgi:hypothetical protein|nr:hypothetical protein [Paenibacillaceae bacterium]
MILNGVKYELKPGSLIVFYPYTLRQWILSDGRFMDSYRMRFEYAAVSGDIPKRDCLGNGMLFEQFPIPDGVYNIRNIAKITQICEKIYQLKGEIGGLSNMNRRILFEQLLTPFWKIFMFSRRRALLQCA